MRVLTLSILGTVALATVVTAGGPGGKHDIVDTAAAAGSFKTLGAALGAANLVDALRGDGPFTVFAPSDDAFAKLPKSQLQALLRPENRGTLQAILTYHVVPGNVRASDVVKLSSATTLNGQRVSIRTEGGRVSIGGATVVSTDIECSNGVIHVIDSVLLPAQDDLAKVATKAGEFRTLITAVQAAGLAKALMGDGPFTVFAPTDDAFAKIPAADIKALLERKNRGKLADILKYHVVPGRVFSDQALQAGTAETLSKKQLSFAIRGGRLQVQNVNVIQNDIQASNGVIHVIDSVLMPPRPRGRKFFGLTYETPSQTLAYQLGLDRQKSLVVASVVKDSNAQSAGLQKYDVITRIDGRPATSSNIDRAKKNNDYEEAVSFEVLRKGKQVTFSIPVGEERH